MKNQTRDFISEFKKTLNSIQSDVKNVSTKIPIQKTLSNFVRYINNSEDYILHYLPTVEKCNSYRWLICLTICCLLTLILIFYLLGLLCGTLGYDQNATPTNRGCVSNTGGVLLMVWVPALPWSVKGGNTGWGPWYDRDPVASGPNTLGSCDRPGRPDVIMLSLVWEIPLSIKIKETLGQWHFERQA